MLSTTSELATWRLGQPKKQRLARLRVYCRPARRNCVWGHIRHGATSGSAKGPGRAFGRLIPHIGSGPSAQCVRARLTTCWLWARPWSAVAKLVAVGASGAASGERGATVGVPARFRRSAALRRSGIEVDLGSAATQCHPVPTNITKSPDVP